MTLWPVHVVDCPHEVDVLSPCDTSWWPCLVCRFFGMWHLTWVCYTLSTPIPSFYWRDIPPPWFGDSSRNQLPRFDTDYLFIFSLVIAILLDLCDTWNIYISAIQTLYLSALWLLLVKLKTLIGDFRVFFLILEKKIIRVISVVWVWLGLGSSVWA